MIKYFSSFEHPNIKVKVFPPTQRIRDMEDFEIFFPLTGSEFVLFELIIDNGVFGLNQRFNFLFTTGYVLVNTRQIYEYYYRSDDSLDAHGYAHKLLFKKKGIQNFTFTADEITGNKKLTVNLIDGNIYHSIGFMHEGNQELLDELASKLTEVLELKKW